MPRQLHADFGESSGKLKDDHGEEVTKIEATKMVKQEPTAEERRRRIIQGEAKPSVCFTDDCHQGLKDEISNAMSTHLPVAKHYCQACHYTHDDDEDGYGPQLRQFLSEKNYQKFEVNAFDLCWMCHPKDVVLVKDTLRVTAFRDGQRNLHFVHVNQDKGRSCKVCHLPHTAEQPMILRKKVSFGDSEWRLKIDFDKTESGGKCVTGCHRELSYDRTKPVGNN
jgi:hypothetical protein